jgi:hypothetical protein
MTILNIFISPSKTNFTMLNNSFNSIVYSLERQLHEEEVRYNEAFRMNAQFEVLKSIRVKIKQLKAELEKEKEESSLDMLLLSNN